MPGGGRRWKTLVSRYRESKLDIAFPTVAHRPWKSLRDSHIPTAPTMLSFYENRSEQHRKEPGSLPDPLQPFRPILGLENASPVSEWVRFDRDPMAIL